MQFPILFLCLLVLQLDLSPGGNAESRLSNRDPWPPCTCAVCCENKSLMATSRMQFDDVGKNQEFTDEQYLICPRVLGFFMVRKTWAQLLVEDVHYVEKNKSDAFNKLVLDQQKTLIRSLVSRHGELSEDRDGGSQQVEDIIEGKGKGVVILLHGNKPVRYNIFGV